MLVGVLVAARAGGGQVRLPALRDEAHRGVAGDVAAVLSIHRLQQCHGVEHLTRRHTGLECQRGEHLRGEGADVRVAGLDHRQVPAVTGDPLILAAHRCAEAVRAEASDPGPGACIVEIRIKDDVEDLVQQAEALDVGLGDRLLARSDGLAGPAVRAGKRLVEHLDDLVHDAGVGAGGQPLGLPVGHELVGRRIVAQAGAARVGQDV